MAPLICPEFRVSALYAEEESDISEKIRHCVSMLRSQGFRIHVFDKTETRESCLKWVVCSDVILIFCTPNLRQFGNRLLPADDPALREKLKNRNCVPVLIQDDWERSLPDWMKGTPPELQMNMRLLDPALRYMEVPLGSMLRQLELDKLKGIISKNGNRQLCPDCISIYRRRNLNRFILYHDQEQTFVRILFALGCKEVTVLPPRPEWIVYEDPDCFLPDSSGQVTVKLARIGTRDLNRSSRNYGAWHLEKPFSITVPEVLLYQDHPQLIGIAVKQLQDSFGPEMIYQEADPDDLHMMDMDLLIPVPDQDTINSINFVENDMESMKEAVDRLCGQANA